jgi:hypothetical protein
MSPKRSLASAADQTTQPAAKVAKTANTGRKNKAKPPSKIKWFMIFYGKNSLDAVWHFFVAVIKYLVFFNIA